MQMFSDGESKVPKFNYPDSFSDQISSLEKDHLIHRDKGVKGIVTNTVVLKDMTDKYGSIIDLTKRYLDITDKKVAIEIDGHSTSELLDVGEKFTKLSDRIILKIPMTEYALEAFS